MKSSGVKDMDKRNCAICKSCLTNIFNINEYPIFECGKCSHRQTFPIEEKGHVESIYSDHYFFDGGAGYPDYLQEGDLLKERGKKYAAILSKEGIKPGRVLDVGCAAGYLLKGFQESGWQGTGIEPNKAMADYGCAILGLNVINQPVENFSLDMEFDLVLLIQVIDHLIDPKRALSKVLNCVRGGGYALVEMFNYKSLTAKLMGRAWHDYIPPSVLHWFSPESLDLLLSGYGFQKVKRGRLIKMIKWSHGKSVLNHKMKELPGGKWLMKPMNLLPDDLTLPYPSEDLYYVLYQKK